jgi:hypothetical protein
MVAASLLPVAGTLVRIYGYLLPRRGRQAGRAPQR